jgi:small GTP-binding protein
MKLKCIVLGAAGAGKTSILRRFYHNNFKHERVPTVGSDFYTRKIPNPVYNSSEEDSAEETQPIWARSIQLEPTVSIQLWDTAGRERLVTSPQKGFSSALGDAFFSNADAAMLVYDATSSTSFTTLIKWYAELMERMHSLDSDDDTTDNENGNSGGDAANTAINGGNSSVNQVSTQNGTLVEKLSSKQRKRKKKRYRFPVLIVANKLDKFKVDTAQPRQRTIVKQRDVMGLNGNFKGKDSRYEYRVEPPRIYDDDDEHSRKKKRKRKMKHRSNNTDDLMEKSTFSSSTGEKWTTDFSYLEHLLKSEDGSHPDRDMVLLWCMRNGLKHAEVSALDGM